MAALAVAALVIAGDVSLARRKVPPAEPAAPASIPTDLFGAGEIAHPPASDFAKWTETMARYGRERRQENALCENGDCALVRWREFLATLKGQDAPAQLRAVNAYFNKLPYRTDLDNYGSEDYWATPRELFARGGDCEDYAIAKYLSLRALGWPAERLRVVVVHDNARDLVHAALIAYHGGDAYLLDIEIAEVTSHRNVARYVPIFSISDTGWWSYKPVAPVDVAKAVSRDPATTPPVEVVKAVTRVSATTPPVLPVAWRSLHIRHKPGKPAKLASRPLPAPRQMGWFSPHLKHVPRQALLAKRRTPVPPAVIVVRNAPPATPVVAREANENEAEATPAPEGERIEEIFLPGAR
jgi:predicted transglutaminase-like cysteine proteinase